MKRAESSKKAAKPLEKSKFALEREDGPPGGEKGDIGGGGKKRTLRVRALGRRKTPKEKAVPRSAKRGSVSLLAEGLVFRYRQ